MTDLIPDKLNSLVGIGLYIPHINEFINHKSLVPWIEIHPENLKMGAYLKLIEKIGQSYPISFHGVGLSLGSEKLDINHLKFLKEMIQRLGPFLISDHLSWSTLENVYINDLLPLSYTQKNLNQFIKNLNQAQDFLECSIIIENPAAYIKYDDSILSEEGFLLEIATTCKTKILLDINNVFVNSVNHQFCPYEYIKNLGSGNLVQEIHLAGHQVAENFLGNNQILIDDHGSAVSPPVWDLYKYALSLMGPKLTLIEWDNQIPPLLILLEEVHKANIILQDLYGTS